jgi:serine phosphatase RsbU (regulator of sigma subunit)
MEVWGGNQASDNGVTMPGLDAWVISRPYQGDDAGGDIHYVSSCNTGRITRVLVADVSGHGQHVAQVALSLRTLMRRFVNYIDQTKLMQGLNQEFASLADLGSFATAVVATYWAPTDYLAISNAGHPRPIWYRSDLRAWQTVAGNVDAPAAGLANIPLGIAEPTAYDEFSIRLSAGDLVLLYTDSLIEAAAPGGRQLGERGLVELLNSLDATSPHTLLPSLLAEVEKFGGGPPKDDVTALLLRPNALKPRPGISTGLKAGYNLVVAFAQSLRPKGQPFPMPQLTIGNILGSFIGPLNRRIGSRKTPN